MTLKSGEPAPAFTLPGTGGRDYSLAGERGHTVVLAFYPGDDTTVCTVQLNSYNDELSAFTELGATVWGISPQGIESHEKFAAKHGFQFPLLADEGKQVGEEFGILGPLGFYRRSVFVVDGEGIVRYAHRSLVGATFKKTPELLDAIKAAQAS
ncbi:MAG: peroxiredoxin [Actinomycetia bacterium]|nr:peroxiredoxin [Actinomycetes bacterium]